MQFRLSTHNLEIAHCTSDPFWTYLKQQTQTAHSYRDELRLTLASVVARIAFSDGTSDRTRRILYRRRALPNRVVQSGQEPPIWSVVLQGEDAYFDDDCSFAAKFSGPATEQIVSGGNY